MTSVVAYVDESEPSAEPDAYVLAAALVDVDRREAIREHLNSLLLPGQRKVRWRNEDRARRRKLAAAVAELQTRHMVVIRIGPTSDHSERRRRRTLERLMYELGTAGVSTAIMESRQHKQNVSDLRHLEILRAQQVVPPGL